MVIFRAVMLLQDKHTRRDVWFVLLFFSLFVLFLFRSLSLSIASISIAYIFLGLSLVVCDVYAVRDLVTFMRQKNEVATVGKVEVEPERKTLGTLAEDGSSAVLGATVQIVTVESDPAEDC